MQDHLSTSENPVAEQAVIMIIDDHPDSLQLLSTILKAQGFKVRQALNGRVALAAIQQHLPDLIILDIRMPDMDGFEVCRQLKNNEMTSGIPVIFISGMGKSEDKIQAFEVGGQDYIAKPFDGTEVLARVKLQLELSSIKQNLEDMVQQRTSKLESANTAMEVLLEHRQTERRKFEENVISHIDSLVFPYLKRLQKTDQDSLQASLTGIIESNLKEITSQFSAKLYSRALGLTRREMEIAALIKNGKTNADMGDILCISEHSVSFHRQNLRKKLGLCGQKVNLVAYLNEIGINLNP